MRFILNFDILKNDLLKKFLYIEKCGFLKILIYVSWTNLPACFFPQGAYFSRRWLACPALLPA